MCNCGFRWAWHNPSNFLENLCFEQVRTIHKKNFPHEINLLYGRSDTLFEAHLSFVHLCIDLVTGLRWLQLQWCFLLDGWGRGVGGGGTGGRGSGGGLPLGRAEHGVLFNDVIQLLLHLHQSGL